MTTNPIPEPSDELVLKPCPWCATAWIKVQRDNPACFCAECQECAVLGPEADTYDGAIAAWNTRAAIAAMPELTELQQIAELREALEWYAEQAAGCRKIGSIGDPARKALNDDGGRQARAALAKARGEQVSTREAAIVTPAERLGKQIGERAQHLRRSKPRGEQVQP